MSANKVIKFQEKKHYGRLYIYAKDEYAQLAILNLTGRKTVTEQDMTSLKDLGVEIEIERIFN